MSAIRPLTFAELDADLADVLRPRYERLGYLGGFFGHMGHQPASLAAFERFTLACREALSSAFAEIVALTAATRLGNDYERHQHERLAVRSGLTAAWIADVERLRPDDAAELDAAERAVQRFVLAAIDDLARAPGNESPMSPGALDAVVATTDDATAAGVALLTARFVGHAVVAAACDLEPPVPSIFDRPPATRPEGQT